MTNPTRRQLETLSDLWNYSDSPDVTDEFMLYAASIGLDGVLAWHYEEYNMTYLHDAEPHEIREMRQDLRGLMQDD